MSDLPAWQIACGEVLILVPACGVGWANVGISLLDQDKRYRPGGHAQYRVSVPDLNREFQREWMFEMPSQIYDQYLQRYRAEILALIERLTAA